MKLTQKQAIEEIKMGKSLKDFPEWCDAEEVVLEAVKTYPWSLQYASDRLKKELLPQVLRVFNYKGGLNPIDIVKYYSDFLRLLTSEDQNDKTIVLEAVKQNGCSLEFASERLRDDRGVVLEAIRQDVYNLKFASERLKKELLLKGLKQLDYKGSTNPIELVKYNGGFLVLLTKEYKNNKEVVLEAVKQNQFYFRYASKEMQNRIGNNNPIEFLEQWIKSEKQQKKLEQQLDKKESVGKIKI